MIIETSLAPSPIDNVIHFPCDLARATTSAFYFGDTRQQITELAIKPSLKNFSEVFLSLNAKAKVGPSITIANFFL